MIEPVALLKDLVRINTTNPPGEEEKLLLYLERILQEHRIPYVYQKSAKGRGNLLAWQLADQAEEAPLILMSHTDVVAAQASQWKFPPFEAQEVDGYIYGRGTVDTKQLTAMELTAFLALKENGYTSDIARTMYFLKPGEEHAPKDAVDCANAAINAVGAVMAKIKPGMRGYEVDAIGRQSIIDSGFPPFPHATGHQVGLEVHDGGTTLGPKKRYSASGILRKNEIYALEPTVLQDRDKRSAIIEDNVLLTEDGCVLISKRQTALIEIPYRTGEEA